MEQNHHLCSARDPDMDTADDNKHMDGMEVEMEDSNSCIRVPDETHQCLPIREGPFNSCKMSRGKFRPRLMATKSFPPYSQCIGGLGEDGDQENEPDLESNVSPLPNEREDEHEETQDAERKTDMSAKYSREVLKVKWGSRRKEMLGSFEVNSDGWERGKCSGKRRMDSSGKEVERNNKEREEGSNSEGKHWKGKSSDSEKKEEEEDRKTSPASAAQEENSISMEIPEGQMEELIEPSAHRHPILSKLLHSSSTSSSCSSINFSSGESDEVFSEGEDTASKRRTFRKCRSWKTFLTVMHWSVRRQSSWVQLAGHQGNFQVSKVGEVLKLYSEPEAKCLDRLMTDPLRPFVPQYHGLVTRGEHSYIRLEDLLSGLKRPVIMDCKMGVRTFQEEELIKAQTKPTPRSDLYQKMIRIDQLAPTEEEHTQKGVTKWRYLQWRDTTSSTSTLGFRIEGIMMEDGSVQRDFRKIQTLSQATEALLYFTRRQLDTLKAYYSRLLDLKDALRNSAFFRTHEVIGSSLLFVHDPNKASVWMIDFGKTTPLPDTREIQHGVAWTEGSREDGYLVGLTSLITCLGQAINMASGKQEDNCEEESVRHEVLSVCDTKQN